MHHGIYEIPPFVLTQQIYSEETNGAHAHYREPVPLIEGVRLIGGPLKVSSRVKKSSFFKIFNF